MSRSSRATGETPDVTPRKKTRAPKGLGSPPKLGSDGLWHAYVPTGRRRPDGTAVKRHIKRKQRDEAIDLYRAALAELDRTDAARRMVEAGTTGEWFKHWVNDIVEPNRKNSTFSGYEGHVRRVILPSIGSIRLSDLSEDHIRRMLSQIPTRPSQLAVLKVVRAAMHVAWEQRAVQENVSLRVSLPRLPVERVDEDDDDELEVEIPRAIRNQDLDLQYVRQIINDSLKWRNGARVALGLIYGLRQSEVLGLCWPDFDFQEKVLHVRRNLGRSEEAWRHGCYDQALCTGKTPSKCPARVKRGRIDTTKTRSSIRDLPLTDEVIAVLKEHRKRQLQERLASGVEWPKREWVFATRNGTPLGHRNDGRQWKSMLKRSGIPGHFTVHAMRHTAATQVAGGGTDPRTIQALMGWSNIQMANVYQHSVDERVRAAVERQTREMFGI